MNLGASPGVRSRSGARARNVVRLLTRAVLLFVGGCGYHFAHAPVDPLGPFAIGSAAIRVPDAALAAAAEEGARAELSRAGQLAPSARGAPAEIEIEVLRVDEIAEGIAAGTQEGPLARGVRVTATGRARIRKAGAGVVRDTGDVRASDVAGTAAALGPAAVARDEAGRAAARRLGEILVRRLLGFPEPGEP